MRLFSDSASRVDDPYLAHALALAERGRGSTAPNPLVGCVVVCDGSIVGEGFHPRAGEPHAEIFALGDAGADARGADVYVTLEPCRHHGRTPPCTDALIAAGVSRVFVGMADPTGEAGGGAQVLRDAGIEVSFAEDPSPFSAINRGWIKRLATGMPFVRVKVGLSIDASPAFSAGERASMTGVHGREVTRKLRAAADAVMVGGTTVLADDPALTVRDEHGAPAEYQPLRVVLLGQETPGMDARVFTDGAAPTLVLGASVPIDALPDNVLQQAVEDRCLATALRAIGDRGVNELLVEAGPRLLTALWADGLVDELVVVTAGGMAGADALRLFQGSPDRIDEALQPAMRPVETGIVGDVAVTVWQPVEPAAG